MLTRRPRPLVPQPQQHPPRWGRRGMRWRRDLPHRHSCPLELVIVGPTIGDEHMRYSIWAHEARCRPSSHPPRGASSQFIELPHQFLAQITVNVERMPLDNGALKSPVTPYVQRGHRIGQTRDDGSKRKAERVSRPENSRVTELPVGMSRASPLQDDVRRKVGLARPGISDGQAVHSVAPGGSAPVVDNVKLSSRTRIPRVNLLSQPSEESQRREDRSSDYPTVQCPLLASHWIAQLPIIDHRTSPPCH